MYFYYIEHYIKNSSYCRTAVHGAMDSLGTGIGTEFLDWRVSEPESESKKLEPGTSYVSLVTFF